MDYDNATGFDTIMDYDGSRYFVTPDRRCEQYLHSCGIDYDHIVKGETGWTYWVYPRTATLNGVLHKYRRFLARRRQRLEPARRERAGS